MVHHHDYGYQELFSHLQVLQELLVACVKAPWIGDVRWTDPQNIAELIDNRIGLDFIPQFRNFKIAENEFSQAELLSFKNLVGALFLVETADPASLGRICEELGTLLAAEEPELYRAFVGWLYNFFSKPLPEGLMEQLDPKEAPTMLATNLKKWEQELIQQGMQQGLQEGILKGKLETARKLKQKGLSIQEIAEVTGLSIETIQNL